MKHPKTTETMAMSLAKVAHSGQEYGEGQDYFTYHLAKVAKKARALAAGTEFSVSDVASVAWLHDSIEDTEVTDDFLRDFGFPEVVIEAVVAITKVEGEEYDTYLARVKSNPLARLVKQADINCNMAAAGKPHLKPKYEKALAFLEQ